MVKAPHPAPARALCQGIAAAAVVGLFLGGALRPELREFEGGPQMLAGVSGHRTYAWDGSVEFTNANGPVPEYVVGTDFTRPVVYPESEAYEVSANEALEDYYDETIVSGDAPAERTEIAATQSDTPSIPSEDGDILAGVGVPAPPEPPVDDTAAMSEG
ncbi:MAG TPA: hypothetical protein VIO94_09180 [Phenylobacterium sp.]